MLGFCRAGVMCRGRGAATLGTGQLWSRVRFSEIMRHSAHLSPGLLTVTGGHLRQRIERHAADSLFFGVSW